MIMYILALVGSSGTGKSHRAIAVAHDHKIDAIIDDGLLIKGSEIVAGKSAKRQATKIGAIRTALFSDSEHSDEVNKAISQHNLERLLILGTSRAMTNRIAENLGMDRPQHYLEITDIATADEIQEALNTRKYQGKHIVPAPTVQVKPRLSGTIIEPVKTLFQRRHQTHPQLDKMWVEQSVVKPTFNSLGRFYIANPVLTQIITYVTNSLENVDKVLKIQVDTSENGVIFNIDIAVYLGPYLPGLAEEIQRVVVKEAEHITALHVIAVNVSIKKARIGQSFLI
ncbi:hypothetical protein [Metallumcola ferriviriculae]